MFDFDIGYTYVIAVVVIIIAFFFMTREPKFNPPPEIEKISGDFTLQQLRQFDGQRKPQVFMAAKGVIYDVTHTTFYTKGGPYQVFAGHDASINLSKMSHDENFLNKWGSFKMTEDQQKILQDWVSRFNEKYRRVGVVKSN